jgi:hypothetical protein
MTTAAPNLQSFRCGEPRPTELTVSVMVRQTGALILLIGIACIPQIGQEIALSILIVVACANPVWTLRSLAAGTVVTFINSPFVSVGGDVSVFVSVFKWMLLFVAFGRSLVCQVQPNKYHTRLVTLWTAVTAVLLANSYFVSSLPVVSALKSISFAVGLVCVIRLTMLTWSRNGELLFFVAELGVAVVITSIPLFRSSAGYSRNSTGFNGILNHPQALGVFLVMTGAATFATALKAPRIGGMLIILGVAQWSMIFFTGARTALVAIAFGGIVYIAETVVRGGSESRLSSLSLPLVAMAITGVMLVAMLSSRVREGFVAFLQKGDEQSIVSADNPEVALDNSSRGDQIFTDLELASEHPLFGYGFGVDPASQATMDQYGAQLAGIPISAPVEQGFLPLATVAQIGLVGSPFMFLFLLEIYRLARADSAEISALFAAVLGVNLGEMIFYSVGGLGIIMWVVLLLFAVGGGFPSRYLRLGSS